MVKEAATPHYLLPESWDRVGRGEIVPGFGHTTSTYAPYRFSFDLDEVLYYALIHLPLRARTASSSGVACPPAARAQALWAAMCFRIFVAD